MPNDKSSRVSLNKGATDAPPPTVSLSKDDAPTVAVPIPDVATRPPVGGTPSAPPPSTPPGAPPTFTPPPAAPPPVFAPPPAAPPPAAPPPAAAPIPTFTPPPAPASPRGGSGSSRGKLIAAIVAAVVLLGGGAAAAIVGSGGSSDDSSPAGSSTRTPVATDNGSATVTVTSTVTPSDTTTTTTDVTSAATTSEPPAAPSAADLETYDGPEGITVMGPAGWSRDGAARVPTIIDYNEPGSPARAAGATFRIGVGNTTPSGSFESEARAAANFLRSNYDADIERGGPQFGSFLGSESVDIQYRYFSTDYGVERRGIERLWRMNGQTYIIQSSGRAGQWAQTQEVFDELVSHAEVD